MYQKDNQPTKSKNHRRLAKVAKKVAPSDQPQKRHTKTYVLFSVKTKHAHHKKPTSTSSLATNGADYSKKPICIELNASEDD